jgi:hypothetical protein
MAPPFGPNYTTLNQGLPITSPLQSVKKLLLNTRKKGTQTSFFGLKAESFVLTPGAGGGDGGAETPAMPQAFPGVDIHPPPGPLLKISNML